MGNVFISYRRSQSESDARALYAELSNRLGPDQVFMDVDDIALGRDFRAILRERLSETRVLLALIGPDWLEAADAAGKRRLDQPNDFVRQEIATALERDIQVIPVLIKGAEMPSQDRLPPDLRELSFRNGIRLDYATWKSTIAELVRGFEAQEGAAEAAGKPSPAAPRATSPAPAPVPPAASSGMMPKVLGGAVALVAVVVVLASMGGGSGSVEAPTPQAAAQAPLQIAAPSAGPSVGQTFANLELKDGAPALAAAINVIQTPDYLASREAVDRATGLVSTTGWNAVPSNEAWDRLVWFLTHAEPEAFSGETLALARRNVADLMAAGKRGDLGTFVGSPIEAQLKELGVRLRDLSKARGGTAQ